MARSVLTPMAFVRQERTRLTQKIERASPSLTYVRISIAHGG
jgi:hypothetical protein